MFHSSNIYLHLIFLLLIFLLLQFDKDGNLFRWTGSPILLDSEIPRDPEILELLAKYRPAVEALTKDVYGFSKVELQKNCTNYECNLGNLITDSWVYSRVQSKQYTGPGWTDASIALVNAGAIRSATTIGELSQFALSTILPFNNSLYVVQVPGSCLKAALEYTVREYVCGGYVRGFLQMSGLHVVFNLSKTPGDRVQSVEVLCSNCSTPVYEPLDLMKVYGVILESFIYGGGDGFDMFESLKAIEMSTTSLDSLTNYIKHVEWIYPAVEGRIKFVAENNNSTSDSSITTPISITLIAVSLLLVKSQF
ncbi:protein 5NUC-like [Sitodiplosis mosellana]|uniref:protein 5NUC-like n=1 Tax=Sitodiplosis mosellana TaxID=263140 RepID=UPI002443D209|nr:protein 5NUC-like [Sitodiplosis mosellana]